MSVIGARLPSGEQVLREIGRGALARVLDAVAGPYCDQVAPLPSSAGLARGAADAAGRMAG